MALFIISLSSSRILAGEVVNHPSARPSAGCGLSAPDIPPSTIEVDGRPREMIVVAPTGVPADRPLPMIFGFHGRTNSNAQVRRYFDLEGQAGQPALFVYPASLKDARGLNIWSDPGDKPENLRDFSLFDRIVEVMSNSYCLDLNRVFVVGHSLGASFANSLACARGGVIRGLAAIGGGITRPSHCSGPVAAMVMHNPRDEQVPISEGLRVRRSLLEQDGLSGGSTPDFPQRFNCRRYGAEIDENPVLWCPLADDRTSKGRFYPHQWPDGVGAAIMAFFEKLD